MAYSYTFVASNTTSYALGTGSLPTGLTLSTGGVLSGTPTANATFTFTVTATGAGGSTASSSQSVIVSAAGARYSYLGLGTAANDLTALTKHATGRYIYIKPTGNDATGDGLSHATAYATVQKAWNTVTSGNGDWILLAGGTSFTDNLDTTGLAKSGKSAIYPNVITSYDTTDPTNAAKFGTVRANVCAGTGANGNTWLFRVSNGSGPINFTVLKNLNFYRVSGDTDTQPNDVGLWFLSLITTGGVNGSSDGFLVEDCLFYKCSIDLAGPGSGYNYVGGSLTNFCVRRSGSTLACATGTGHHAGIHSDNAPGLIVEDSIFDHAGWLPGGRASGGAPAATADQFKHCLYLATRTKNPTVRRNLVSRASAFGAVARGGGTYQDNVWGDNPYAIGMNHGDLTSYSYVAGYAVSFNDLICSITGNLVSGTASVLGASGSTGGGGAFYMHEIAAANTHLIQNNVVVSEGGVYSGTDLQQLSLSTDLTSNNNLFLSYAANTTDGGSAGTFTGNVAIAVNACTITYNNNLCARWGTNSYAFNGNVGTNAAVNSVTRTNNVWSTEAAVGSNVTFASVSGGYLAPTRDVAAYATANGYASSDALYDYAALHPEINWALNIRNWVFAGYNR